MCMYCRELDHVKKDCPTLIEKWKEKRNKNVHVIVVEEHNEKPNIEEVTRGGSRNRENVTNQGIEFTCG